jgi:hypothetical protein
VAETEQPSLKFEEFVGWGDGGQVDGVREADGWQVEGREKGVEELLFGRWYISAAERGIVGVARLDGKLQRVAIARRWIG